MLRIKDVVPARKTLVEGDRYIDLAIEWPTGHSGHAFTFGLHGTEGGFAEFDVDHDSGSLRWRDLGDRHLLQVFSEPVSLRHLGRRPLRPHQ